VEERGAGRTPRRSLRFSRGQANPDSSLRRSAMSSIRRRLYLLAALLAGSLAVLLTAGVARADMGLPPF